MTTEADPLLLVFEYYLSNQNASLLDHDRDHISDDYQDLRQATYLQFGVHVFEIKQHTTFKSNDPTAPPYTLGVLYHASKTKNLDYTQYFRDAIDNAGFPVPLNFTDRKKFLNELNELASNPPTSVFTKVPEISSLDSTNDQTSSFNEAGDPINAPSDNQLPLDYHYDANMVDIQATDEQPEHLSEVKPRSIIKQSGKSPAVLEDDQQQFGQKRSDTAQLYPNIEKMAYIAKRAKLSLEYQADKKWLEENVTAFERVLVTRESVMNAHKPVSQYLELANDLFSKPKPPQPHQIRVSNGRNGPPSSKAPQSSLRPRSKESKIPIIMVPPAMTSMITMWNAESFLKGDGFVDSMTSRSQANKQKPTKIRFALDDKEYEIADLAETLKPEDWDRVAGVIVDGHDWQFKNWKWTTPEDIFRRVKAFYFKYSHQEVDKNVLKWGKAVDIMNISRDYRHKDAEAHVQFWRALESHILSRFR